jgi:hypothetical protein
MDRVLNSIFQNFGKFTRRLIQRINDRQSSDAKGNVSDYYQKKAFNVGLVKFVEKGKEVEQRFEKVK